MMTLLAIQPQGYSLGCGLDFLHLYCLFLSYRLDVFNVVDFNWYFNDLHSCEQIGLLCLHLAMFLLSG